MDSKQGEKRYYQVSFAVRDMYYIEAYSKEEAVNNAWRLVTAYPDRYVVGTPNGGKKADEIPAYMQ